MTDTVIKLTDHKAHIFGEAVCTGCGYEWAAVAPVGAYGFECSECGSSKGIFKHPVVRNEDVWQCNCGSELFYINPNGPYCRECGEYAAGWLDEQSR